MSVVLECSNLVKNYGRHEAVRNLDMKLEENTIYGLLGRNGAGKTTLLNMLTGGVFPNFGHIEIAGNRLKEGDTPHGICFIRERNLFFEDATVMETLQLASKFHKNWDWAFANELIKLFKLNAGKKMKQLSRGMESLVGNTIGLASRAPITFYDEPVLGLDVLMRERFYKVLVQDYANYPRTILLSTHLIDEIAKVVERVYIMESGTILMEDEVDNIRNHSYVLVGNHEVMESFIGDRQVFYMEDHVRGILSAVYGTFTETDKMQANKLGISIEGLPLQKFFSYLIEGGQHNE
ncbi:ABC transporter ATP-binding protein [Paenibacillus sp. N1-5-1-14]|uniref:ATP-binding cassette domain-containing protein n=1 Tax=Paenibacillus radicibacter TaxID=2972488 RepID=UPI0021590F9B|nr:ABC transporter ATP-binding protein [Paenibacillus radicibacter]MCR8644231.1 ABC transporter ATP-binding protein [Paenibacillus radicibacter]